MKTNWDILKARYLQASRASQIDSLSMNLTKLQALADSDTEATVAYHLVRESQFFIEWTVPAINLEDEITLATELLDLHRLLSHWKLDWPELWGSELERQKIAVAAQQWCEHLQGQSEILAG